MLKNVDIYVDPVDYEQSAKSILAEIKPGWKADRITIKPMQFGMVNRLLRCSSGDHMDSSDDVIMIRVFGHVDGYNRETEVHIMSMLSERGVIPKLHCRFRNGIVYDYAPGEVLSDEDIKDPNVLRLLAEKLHSVHSLDVGDYFSRVGKLGQMELMQSIWQKVLSSDYSQVYSDPRYVASLPPADAITRMLEEMTKVYNEFSTSGRYPLVFCHLDAHKKNIVYCRETNALALLDWEACQMGPEIYEVVVLIDRDFTPYDKVRESLVRREWLQTYLSTHPVHGSKPITEELLQQWYRDSVQASVVSTFCCFLFGLYSVKHVAIEEDFLGNAIFQYEKMVSYKKELEDLDAAKDKCASLIGDLLFVDVMIDAEDYRSSALTVLATIKPQWNKQTITVKPLGEGTGCVNRLLKCSYRQDDVLGTDVNALGDDGDVLGEHRDANENVLGDNHIANESVILRIFGNIQLTKESNIYTMKKLSDAGLVPPMYCRFRNGVAYKYAEGEVLSREQLKDEKVRRLLAEAFHTMHQLDPDEYIGKCGKPSYPTIVKMIWESVTNEPDNVTSAVTKLPRYAEQLPPIAALTPLVDEFQQIWTDLESRSPSVFAHADAHQFNIIYDKQTEKLALIDWDDANVCPEIYDVAIVAERDPHFTDVFTDSESRRAWLKTYFSTHPIHGASPITEQLLQQWYRDCIQATSISQILNLLFFVERSIHSDRRDEFIEMSIKCYTRYVAYKQELQELDAACKQ